MLRIGTLDIAPRNIPLMIIAASIILPTFFITIRQKKVDPLGNISLWTLTFFLIFKDVWEYHYVILIPLFVAYYLQTRSRFILALFIILADTFCFLRYRRERGRASVLVDIVKPSSPFVQGAADVFIVSVGREAGAQETDTVPNNRDYRSDSSMKIGHVQGLYR